MARITVNEKSILKVDVTFLTDANVPTPPSTARWSLYNETTDEDVIDWTDVTVPTSGVVQVTIPAGVLACSTNKNELFVLAAESEYGTDNQVSNEFEIMVTNLRKSGV